MATNHNSANLIWRTPGLIYKQKNKVGWNRDIRLAPTKSERSFFVEAILFISKKLLWNQKNKMKWIKMTTESLERS